MRTTAAAPRKYYCVRMFGLEIMENGKERDGIEWIELYR